MKLLLLAILLPIISFAQEKKSFKQQKAEMKADQAIADTMHFPSPFEFKYVDSIGLSKTVLYSKCLQWITTVLMGNIKKELQIQDSLTGKLVVTNIEAWPDITQSLTIDVREGKYRLTLDKYRYDRGSAYSSPQTIETIKESSYLRLEKYYIIRQNDALFKSLKEYVSKEDKF